MRIFFVAIQTFTRGGLFFLNGIICILKIDNFIYIFFFIYEIMQSLVPEVVIHPQGVNCGSAHFLPLDGSIGYSIFLCAWGGLLNLDIRAALNPKIL